MQNYVKAFVKQDINYFNAVQQIFQKYPENTVDDNVAVKSAVLNQLYRTYILDIDSIIDHIKKLGKTGDLDSLLNKGNIEAIEKIRKGHGISTRSGNERDNYSFATKYCHFSNPGSYPLFDQYVEWAIWELWEKKEIHIDLPNGLNLCKALREPEHFRKIVNDIIHTFDLKDYQTADRALWKYGKSLAEIEEQKKKIRHKNTQ